MGASGWIHYLLIQIREKSNGGNIMTDEKGMDINIAAIYVKFRMSPTGFDGKIASIIYDFGGTLKAAVALFTAEVIYTQFVAAAKVTAQSAMRRMIEKGIDPADIATKMAGWKPGIAMTREGGDPGTAMLAKFGTLSPEEQNAYLDSLRKVAAGK